MGSNEAWHQRVLRIAITVSLVGHFTVLGTQLLLLKWQGRHLPRRAKLIYHREPVKSTSAWTREEPIQAQTRLKALARALPISGGGTMPGSITVGVARAHGVLGAAEPGRSWGAISETGSEPAEGWEGRWAAAVDLTNLTAAAQGNPLLYTYFGAIREQIQHTANGRDWASQAPVTSGVVYVGFVLERAGGIQSAAIITERSAGSPQLQDTALRIVQASGPFPPFPPSFPETTKTIIIPIEFSPTS